MTAEYCGYIILCLQLYYVRIYTGDCGMLMHLSYFIHIMFLSRILYKRDVFDTNNNIKMIAYRYLHIIVYTPNGQYRQFSWNRKLCFRVG